MKLKILALGAGLALVAGAAAIAADEAPGKHNEERVVIVTGGLGGDHHAGMDANKDGDISRDEFRAMHDSMFAEIDENGDGKLSDEEFRGHHGPGGENINVRIEGPGSHGSGDAEWVERRGPQDGRPGEEVRIIRHGPGHGPGGEGPGDLDKDKDGKISFDEFAAPLREHFQEADKNKNGFLDKDELGRDHVFMIRRSDKPE